MAKLLVVGSVAFDAVKTPFGQRERALGGSATYFSVSASYFTDVAVIAVVGEDFDASSQAIFQKHGIDTDGLERRPGKTFFWSGEYGENLNEARTLETELNVFQDFAPKLPEHYRNTEFLFLANIDPELQRDVMGQVKSPGLVACDTMNYWIEGKPEALRRTLESVDIVVINDAEAKQLAGRSNIVAAARDIMAIGPGTIVVKRGEYGVVMFSGKDCFGLPALPVENVVDPTGAGDTFAGGFMGYLASCGTAGQEALRKAVVYGSVMASFNIEAFSQERLSSLTRQDIDSRFREFADMARF